MFGGKKQNTTEVDDLRLEVKQLKSDLASSKSFYTRELDEVKRQHKNEVEDLAIANRRAIETKEFEMKHFKDKEIKNAIDEKIALEKKVAVLEAENKMLNKITDLNGDVLDVKNLVNSLINKLPTINLKSLTVQGDK